MEFMSQNHNKERRAESLSPFQHESQVQSSELLDLLKNTASRQNIVLRRSLAFISVSNRFIPETRRDLILAYQDSCQHMYGNSTPGTFSTPPSIIITAFLTQLHSADSEIGSQRTELRTLPVPGTPFPAVLEDKLGIRAHG